METLWTHFPGLKIVGEEDTIDIESKLSPDVNLNLLDDIQIPDLKLPRDRIVVWIDPIDGTRNLVSGHRELVTSLIGVTLDEKPIFGVIHHPFSECGGSPTYFGGRGIPLRKTCDVIASVGQEITLGA